MSVWTVCVVSQCKSLVHLASHNNNSLFNFTFLTVEVSVKLAYSVSVKLAYSVSVKLAYLVPVKLAYWISVKLSFSNPIVKHSIRIAKVDEHAL